MEESIDRSNTRTNFARGNQRSAMRTFLKIASLAVEARRNPAFGQDSHTTLNIYRNAQALTRTWLEDAEYILRQHGVLDGSARPSSEPYEDRDQARQGLLSAIIKIAPMAMRSFGKKARGGNGEMSKWRLTLTKEMYDVLVRCSKNAEEEIERLEKLLERRIGRPTGQRRPRHCEDSHERGAFQHESHSGDRVRHSTGENPHGRTVRPHRGRPRRRTSSSGVATVQRSQSPLNIPPPPLGANSPAAARRSDTTPPFDGTSQTTTARTTIAPANTASANTAPTNTSPPRRRGAVSSKTPHLAGNAPAYNGGPRSIPGAYPPEGHDFAAVLTAPHRPTGAPASTTPRRAGNAPTHVGTSTSVPGAYPSEPHDFATAQQTSASDQLRDHSQTPYVNAGYASRQTPYFAQPDPTGSANNTAPGNNNGHSANLSAGPSTTTPKPSKRSNKTTTPTANVEKTTFRPSSGYQTYPAPTNTYALPNQYGHGLVAGPPHDPLLVPFATMPRYSTDQMPYYPHSHTEGAINNGSVADNSVRNAGSSTESTAKRSKASKRSSKAPSPTPLQPGDRYSQGREPSRASATLHQYAQAPTWAAHGNPSAVPFATEPVPAAPSVHNGSSDIESTWTRQTRAPTMIPIRSNATTATPLQNNALPIPAECRSQSSNRSSKPPSTARRQPPMQPMAAPYAQQMPAAPRSPSASTHKHTPIENADAEAVRSRRSGKTSKASSRQTTIPLQQPTEPPATAEPLPGMAPPLWSFPPPTTQPVSPSQVPTARRPKSRAQSQRQSSRAPSVHFRRPTVSNASTLHPPNIVPEEGYAQAEEPVSEIDFIGYQRPKVGTRYCHHLTDDVAESEYCDSEAGVESIAKAKEAGLDLEGRLHRADMVPPKDEDEPTEG